MNGRGASNIMQKSLLNELKNVFFSVIITGINVFITLCIISITIN